MQRTEIIKEMFKGQNTYGTSRISNAYWGLDVVAGKSLSWPGFLNINIRNIKPVLNYIYIVTDIKWSS